MDIYTRVAPTPDNKFAYVDSYIKLTDNNRNTTPTPFFHKKDLTPTNILPEYGILDIFNRKEYFYDPFYKPPVNPNNTFLYQSYPSFYPENNNINSGSTVDYGLQTSSVGRTVGNIVY